MAGYVIHLAVAKEYLRNFRIKDEKEFLRGIIAPDLLSHGDKTTTHYSEHGGSGVNLKEFLKHNSISTEYMQGYFLHLVTDYLFYDTYFPNTINETRQYNDYDILNKELIEEYSIDIPEDIKDVVQFKTGELELLDREKIDQMIQEISKKSLSEYKKEAMKTEKVTTNLDENEMVTMNESKKDKIKLAIAIIAMCFVMLFFVNQKQGFHCDEIFSYGSSNSAYENVFWSYRDKTPMHKFMEAKIFQDGNIFDWIGRIKYYFVDHVDEKDEFIAEKMAEEKMIWRTREEAIDYLEAKDNRFNYASVYYNQIQDVHPPLFYFLVHTVSSIFNNTFSKYIIFFINLPFFIGTCILIWKILNLIRKKININISSIIIWFKYRWNINNDVPKNVYDVYIFYNSIFIFELIHSKKRI